MAQKFLLLLVFLNPFCAEISFLSQCLTLPNHRAFRQSTITNYTNIPLFNSLIMPLIQLYLIKAARQLSSRIRTQTRCFKMFEWNRMELSLISMKLHLGINSWINDQQPSNPQLAFLNILLLYRRSLIPITLVYNYKKLLSQSICIINLELQSITILIGKISQNGKSKLSKQLELLLTFKEVFYKINYNGLYTVTLNQLILKEQQQMEKLEKNLRAAKIKAQFCKKCEGFIEITDSFETTKCALCQEIYEYKDYYAKKNEYIEYTFYYNEGKQDQFKKKKPKVRDQENQKLNKQ